MAQNRSSTPLRAALVFFVVVVAVFLWGRNSDSPATEKHQTSTMSGQSQDNALAKVVVDLKQTGNSPPTLAVTVTNNHDAVLTLLNWDSPLDPAAVALGVFSITPEGASAPLDLPTITFRRVMPPPPENLITLQPGKSTTVAVSFQEPAVPVTELGKKARVRCQGTWAATWPGFTAEQLTPEVLDKLQFSDQAVTGPFQSEEIELVIG